MDQQSGKLWFADHAKSCIIGKRVQKIFKRSKFRWHFHSFIHLFGLLFGKNFKTVLVVTSVLAMLIQFIFLVKCLELALSSRLTPLTIDEHPCKPEKIRVIKHDFVIVTKKSLLHYFQHQNRYICDSKGNVECLAGWTNQNYSMSKHFPCSVPICDPPCLNGVCKAPDVCSCDIGW